MTPRSSHAAANATDRSASGSHTKLDWLSGTSTPSLRTASVTPVPFPDDDRATAA
jgi:hypothetical protein